jgi:flagellin
VTSVTSTVTTSVATSYNFIASPKGDTAPVQAQPLTAEAFGLDAIDWNDPGSLATLIDQAMTTAISAATYFGEREQSFDRLILQNTKLADSLQAGVGNLVDADLARDSAKLQAGQTRQSLAQTALAIANAAPSMLLKLFKL